MKLATDLYVEQAKRWPPAGRHILAHHDAKSIIVYQAYRPSIGRFTVERGYFGGCSLSRMSWIKPNFLWMMYRSGWGTKENQEVVLGLRLRRPFFDGMLARAIASTFDASGLSSREEWAAAVAASEVRLQWDPDHDPYGRVLPRRAVQLGLRGAALEAFGKRELLEVIDMTAFVAAQRDEILRNGLARLWTPVERTYVPSDAAAKRLMLDPGPGFDAGR